MTKGNQSFLVNNLLRRIACFQAHVFPSRLNTMTLASLKPIVPSEREASILHMFLFFFPNSSYIFLFETPILDNNLKSNIPWHSVRAAIREEQWGKNTRGTYQNYPPILSEEVTASLPIPPPQMEKKKKKKVGLQRGSLTSLYSKN